MHNIFQWAGVSEEKTEGILKTLINNEWITTIPAEKGFDIILGYLTKKDAYNSGWIKLFTEIV